MIDIAFVVLQYGGYADTKCCLDSIKKKIDTDSFAVVVVDNASQDSAYQEIKSYIDSLHEERFHLLRNESNLGFANGNNAGITFAREKLDAQFVAVINNDIELVSDNVYRTIKRKFLEKKFAVLGPLILSGDGHYMTNPMAQRLFSMGEIDHEIQHSERILKLNEAHLLKAYNAYKKARKKKKVSTDISGFRTEQMDIKLHGCFLVMSPEFFKELTGFNPRTFLYMEEDILLLELLSHGLHSLYTPEICAFHKEGATTARADKYDRIKLIYSNRLKSQRIYKELLQGTYKF